MEQVEHRTLLEDKPFMAILKFSAFFIIGDLLQQLYNVFDSIIVGNFVSKNALAAIGAASPIMNLIMFIIIGFTIGSGIVFSRYFGKKDYFALKKSLSSALLIGLVFTLIITTLSFVFAKPFLRLLKTPNEIIDHSLAYLYIIFAANFFTYLYNFYCYAIRSIGNSFTPLVFLIISVVLNVILDMLFVIVFNWKIEGAAIATALSQLVSSILIIVYTNKKVAILKLNIKELIIDKTKVKEILSYSSSVALQQSFVYIGRIGVQGLFNSYGTDVIAGVNAAEKLNNVFQTPLRGYTNALTTYYSQNFGANNIDRLFKGYKASWIVVLINAVIFTLIGTIFSIPLVDIFIKEEAVNAIINGSQFIFSMSIGLVLAFIIVQHQSFMRGIGYLKPFFISTFIAITCRITFTYVFDHFYGLKGAYYAPTASWIVGALFNILWFIYIYYKRFKKIKARIKKKSIL